MRIRLFSLLSLRLTVRNCSVIVRHLCRWLLFQMNPVVVLFLALNGVIGFPMDQGAEWRPKDSSPTPASSLTLLHPRTRSLPHFPLATGNDHPATGEDDERSAGRVKQGSSLSASAVDKDAVSFSDVGIDLLIGFLEQQWKKRGGQPAQLAAPAPDPTVSTTTQPATVDIKTLPGYWLKDPFRVEPPSWHVVDYRTERYRLDDLLLMKDKDGSKSI